MTSGPRSTGVAEDKLRILYVGNSSYLSSGYSTYSHEVLSRLHKTGKFQLAELGQFGAYDDPRALDLPWKHYPVVPNPAVPEEVAEYTSDHLNEYGAYKFERTCLDFRPDVIMNVDDWWGSEFIYRSPFRRHFHFCPMPTADAAPLMDQWVESYRTADAVFAYTDWSADLMRGYGVNVIGTASPGADIDVFRPVASRDEHRASLGLPTGHYIVGVTQRNQPRKLFPDLIEAFAEFRRSGHPDVRDRTFLYMHTAYPDQGWDIVRLVLDAGIGDRALVTYRCKACGHAFPSLLAGPTAACPRCKAIAATMPDSSHGLSREQLAGVYQTYDVLIQYSTNEGFGMPMVEAAACGVPVFAVDYSAMSDVVRKVGGFPIKVQRFITEAATGRRLAYPDNADLVEQLSRYLAAPTVVKHRREAAARAGAAAHYTYDRAAAVWEKYLSGVKPKRTWNEPLRLHTPRVDAPANLADEEFVRWAFSNTLGRPDLAHSYAAVKAARDLMYGTTAGFVGGSVVSDAAAHGRQAFSKLQPFDRDNLLGLLVGEAERANRWERERGKALGVTA